MGKSDFKYHEKNPLEKLHEGEPFFFLRAQDRLAPDAVRAYADLLKRESDKASAEGDQVRADGLLKQSLGVLRAARAFMEWQVDNPSMVKLPD